MLLEGENYHGGKESKDRIIVFIYKYGWIWKYAITGKKVKEAKVLQAYEAPDIFIQT
jgi:hypothetical protein